MRVIDHPILGPSTKDPVVEIIVDGMAIQAVAGESIAAALLNSGKRVFRYTRKFHHPRGVFCAIGKCTDCMMTVNGVPNVRTCVTPVSPGMKIQTQHGRGELSKNHD